MALPVTVYAILEAFKRAVMHKNARTSFHQHGHFLRVFALKGYLEDFVLAHLAHTGYMKLL